MLDKTLGTISIHTCIPCHLKFESCPADPDVWMRKALKGDGNSVWEYVLLYTDEAIVISENDESVLHNEFGKYFELKEQI